MEILHVFGIDWRLLIIQVVNFGVLMALLYVFLYGPLMRLLDERRAKIEKGVKDADRAAHDLARAEEERRSIVAAAAKEADAMAERARKDAAAKEKQASEDAEGKAARIVSAAEAEAEELRQKALMGAKEEMARLIVLGAEKALSGPSGQRKG